MPASSAASSTSRQPSSSSFIPKLLVPSPTRLTTRPDVPRRRYSIAGTYRRLRGNAELRLLDVAAVTAARGAPHQQHDDGAEHGPDDAAGLQRALVQVLAEQHVAEEATDEAADHTEQDGHADAHRVVTGHQCPGQEPRDEADDDDGEDEADHENLRGRGRCRTCTRALTE